MHLCSVAFVQVLCLCEHILYPTGKRPLAFCNEVFIPASKFDRLSVHLYIQTDYPSRRIIHLSSSAKTN